MFMKAGRVVIVIAASWLAVGCVSNERFESASTEIENQDEVIRKLRDRVQLLERRNKELENANELAEVELDRLRQRAVAADDVNALRDELARLRASFAELGQQDTDIQVRNTPEGPALSIAGNVAFEIARHEISARGREILRKVAERLQGINADIRVEGHTDSVPLVRTLDRYPLGNLELSGRRAIEVADFLIEKTGLPRQRVSFAGYGAERPVADNATEAGRRENRRVDIVILEKR